MSRHLEIERKFLVEQPPVGWKHRASSPILQGYFPDSTRRVEIRLRRHGSKHFITVKGGHGLRRIEEEIALTAATFRALWPLTQGARVAKRRYRFPCDGYLVELDVYQGPHRGLITAEIEFVSERASRAFQPPRWLGREVTGQRRYANAVLARHQKLPRRLSRV